LSPVIFEVNKELMEFKLQTHKKSLCILQLINVCVNDSQRIYDAILLTPLLFMTVPILFMVAYSTYLIGYWGLLGFIVVFGSILIKVGKGVINIVLACKMKHNGFVQMTAIVVLSA